MDDYMSIHNTIVMLLRQHCDVTASSIGEETRLQEDLGLDSMGLLTLALEIENHWQVSLEEPPDHPPRTMGELVALVAQRRQEKQPSPG